MDTFWEQAVCARAGDEGRRRDDEFVEDAADPEPRRTGVIRALICRRPLDDFSIFRAQQTSGAVPHASKVVAPNVESGRPRLPRHFRNSGRELKKRESGRVGMSPMIRLFADR